MRSERRHGGCLSTLLSLLVSVALLLVIWFVLVLYVPFVQSFTARLLAPVSSSLPAFVSNALYGTAQTYTPRVVEVSEIDEDGLAYLSLGDEQKRLYQQLLDGILAREENFTVYDASMEDLEPTYHAVLIDHPELFWLDGSTRYKYFEAGGPITVTPGLSVPLDQVDAMQAEIEEVVQAFLSTIPEGADDYQKAKTAYEYLISTTDYDVNSSQNQNMQSALLGHASVCAGYARAYQYLLQRSGVFCSYVEGSIPSSEEEHAWNIVRMDGAYTYVDITWGDPTYPGLEGSYQGIVYDYLGLTTEELTRDDHAFSDEGMWPTCDSSDCSYYAREGLLHDSADQTVLSSSLWRQQNAGSYPLAFKFTNPEAYTQARTALESGDFLLNDIREVLTQKGTIESGYQYQVSDALYIIKLFL